MGGGFKGQAFYPDIMFLPPVRGKSSFYGGLGYLIISFMRGARGFYPFSMGDT